MKTTTIDTHSLTPNSQGIEEGDKVKVNGKEYTCTRASAYQAFFAKQGFNVPGASKATPVEIELELGASEATEVEAELPTEEE